MNRGILLNRTMSNISLLPDWGLKEVSDYVDFLLKSFEDKEFTEGIMNLVSESKSFDFLNDEEELYDEADIIEEIQGKIEELNNKLKEVFRLEEQGYSLEDITGLAKEEIKKL